MKKLLVNKIKISILTGPQECNSLKMNCKIILWAHRKTSIYPARGKLIIADKSSYTD
jgi:hypothetical protein